MPDASVTFRISIDPSLIPDADVSRVLAALEDFAPVLEQLGDIMSEAQKDNFATQGEAFGQPWKALAPSTLAEKARLGYPPDTLIRTHKLEQAAGASEELTGSSVTTGFGLSEVPYAAYHDQGRGNNPTRILVAISPQEEETMRQAVQDWIDAEAGGISGITVSIEET